MMATAVCGRCRLRRRGVLVNGGWQDNLGCMLVPGYTPCPNRLSVYPI